MSGDVHDNGGDLFWRDCGPAGVQGVICLIDEMQNWFSSNQSKNFPPEMLQVVTQNRKNRRVIMGSDLVLLDTNINSPSYRSR